jgi:multisubunit Na+/H+ antiporter MnhE subunit
MKRITIAILFGLVAGALCASGAFYGHMLTFSAVTLVWILLNRAVMGFAIGASGLKLHWAWNGIVMGLVVGSIFSYFMFMNNGAGPLPIINFFVNGLFGLMIEFFTTVVFKQPSLARAK